MANKYSVTPEKADQFVAILLVDYLINRNGNLPLLMNDNFKVLEPVTMKLATSGYLRPPTKDEKYMGYIVTDKGRDALAKFMQRYSEYLKLFDVFCAVDLTEGTFAFAKYFDFDTDDEWFAYLNKPGWEDVRVAVAEFKKMDAVEIVFMSFINEGRFDFEKTGWQFDISSGDVWSEIEQICNAALTVEQINQGDDTVMPDIIGQGADLTVSLMKQEEERRKNDELAQQEADQQNQTETITEETYTYPATYYESYYDPYYVSPLWLGVLFLL